MVDDKGLNCRQFVRFYLKQKNIFVFRAKQSSGKAKVTISGRKVINNVTHYRVKSGAGFDFKAIYGR